MVKFLFITRDQMTDDGYRFHYRGLDTSKFVDIRYNEEATQAVIRTTQVDIPANIQQITEAEYNNYLEQWSKPSIYSGLKIRNNNVESRLIQIEDTVDLILLKQEGIL